jgi:ABC-type enterobactin transport system permease subunit
VRAKTVQAIRTPGGLSVRVDPRMSAVVLLLTAAVAAAGVVLIGSGDFPISPGEVIATLLGNGTPAQEFIVQDLRLPRALVGLLVGASLALSGAIFQSISRNPLGSPDVIGFAQGATVGALSVIVIFDAGAVAVAGGAVVGGVLTGVAVYLLAWKRGVHGYRLVLVGIGIAAMLTAAAGPIAFVALSAPQLARRLTRSPGPNLAAAAVMGAALLLVADWVATTAFGERQLPVGVVTGVLGGCYLLWLLVTERKAGRI